MTREEAIKLLRNWDGVYIGYSSDEVEEAHDMAIKALSQEPCEDAEQIDYYDDFVTALKKISDYKRIKDMTDEEVYKRFVEPHHKFNKSEPCDDAISREAVLSLFDKSTFASWDLTLLERKIKVLPPVTQKAGKWDRLYRWLNDMRLGIAPDETVTDIDERSCRESQTDILDEIMEWMIKAESEDKE